MSLYERVLIDGNHDSCHVLYYKPVSCMLIGVSYKVYLGAVISAIILVVLAVSVTG